MSRISVGRFYVTYIYGRSERQQTFVLFSTSEAQGIITTLDEQTSLHHPFSTHSRLTSLTCLVDLFLGDSNI